MGSKAAHRRDPTAGKIIKALKKHSPESTLRISDIGARADRPPAQSHSLPRISICCGCMCQRLGLICECQGEGCFAGFRAHFEMENGRCITTIEPPDEVPLPINQKKSFSNLPGGFTKYMAPQPHDIDKQLEEQVKNGMRDLVLAYNEAMAFWLYDDGDCIWQGFNEEDYFLDLEPQCQMVLESIQKVIAASLDQYKIAPLVPVQGSDENGEEDEGEGAGAGDEQMVLVMGKSNPSS